MARKSAKRWDGLGLTPQVLERCSDCLPQVLADGPLRAREVIVRLRESGVPIPQGSDGTLGMHVLFHASTHGLVCRGPDIGRDSTYVLVDQWVPDAPAGPRGDEALAELARRYFAAYSPATGADFTAWSGLPARRALDLIKRELMPCLVHGRVGYRLGTVEPERGVGLPPAFDNYLLGYRERDPIIKADRVAEVYVGGIIRPTLLVDGRVVGRWRLVRKRSATTVELTPFGPLPRKVQRGIEAEVADIARFLALPTTLTLTDSAHGP